MCAPLSVCYVMIMPLPHGDWISLKNIFILKTQSNTIIDKHTTGSDKELHCVYESSQALCKQCVWHVVYVYLCLFVT